MTAAAVTARQAMPSAALRAAEGRQPTTWGALRVPLAGSLPASSG